MDYAQKGGEEGRDSRGAERRGEREGMGRGWLKGKKVKAVYSS